MDLEQSAGIAFAQPDPRAPTSWSGELLAAAGDPPLPASPAASDAAPPAATARPRVVLTVIADAPTRKRLEASLSELLDRLKVSLVVRDAQSEAPAGPALATATVDFSEPERCTLTLDDAEGRLGLRRRLGGAPNVLVEAVAHVIHSAIEELVLPRQRILAAPPIVAAEAPAAVEKPAPAPAPARPRESGLDVGVEAGARALAAQAPAVVSLGLGARVHTLWSGRDVGASLGLGFVPDIDTSRSDVELHGQSVSLRALFSLTLASSLRWGLEAGVGGGAELLVARVSSSLVPQSRVRPPRLDATGVLAAALTFRLAVAENADVYAAASADFDLSPIDYVARLGPATEPLLTSWPLRPTLVLGVRLSPWGRTEPREVSP